MTLTLLRVASQPFVLRFSCLVCLSVDWCVALFSLLLICVFLSLFVCLSAFVCLLLCGLPAGFPCQSLERMFGMDRGHPTIFAGELSPIRTTIIAPSLPPSFRLRKSTLTHLPKSDPIIGQGPHLPRRRMHQPKHPQGQDRGHPQHGWTPANVS